MRPVFVTGVQGFLNQQPFKAGAIDKKVTFNQLAPGQSECFNIAIVVLQDLGDNPIAMSNAEVAAKAL